MSFRTEDYIISGSGRYNGIYTIKEISWGEDNDISNVCTTRILGEKPIIRFDFPRYNNLLFAKSIIKWPLEEEVNENNINNLPKTVAEQLFKIVRRLNTVDDGARRDFLLTSEAKSSQIQPQESS